MEIIKVKNGLTGIKKWENALMAMIRIS